MLRRIMCLSFVPVLLFLVAFSGPSAHAMMVDIPLPILVANSDMIIEVEIVKKDEPFFKEVLLPGYKKARWVWLREYEVVVKKELRRSHRAPESHAAKKITILTQAAKPRPADGLRMVVMDGPQYAKLMPGAKHVLVLKKMPKEKGFYLAPYSKNYPRADSPLAQQVAGAADVNKWGWGGKREGLQIAVVLGRKRVWIQNQRGGPRSYIQYAVALRNNTGKAVVVNTYPVDKCLSLSLRSEDGNAIPVDIYAHLRPERYGSFDPKYMKAIKPGEIVFVGPNGLAPYGLGHQAPLTAGTWALRATYKSTRKAQIKDTGALWTGELTSEPSVLEAEEMRVNRR
jgi:hypothetical protein